jgi:DMSO/TMAO reductase YedYZ molybdopterin-dependent catalytic subunit
MIGVLAGVTAISVAELVAAFDPRLRNPLFEVGDRVIDAAPPWLKDFAIATFGTNDKIALLVGIGIFLTGISAVIGLFAFRHRIVTGLIGIGLFTAVGVASAVAGPVGPIAAVPTLIGGLAGAAVLVWFDRPLGDEVEDRRVFLTRFGLALGGAMVAGVGGRLLTGRLFPVNTEGASLPAVANPLPQLPAGADFRLRGLAPFRTPNADFYRIDTALSVPRINPDEFTLRIHGMVDRELTISYEDLVRRAQVESDITMTCVSNEVGGQLVGTARWQGVRLDELLAEVGLDPSADQVVGRSVDDYTCGFPVSAAIDGRDALVAIGMNGEPLPIEHGFPARLIVPGLYGYVSATKWLKEIEITRFDAFDQYWVPRGWANRAPIKTSSRIDTPGAFANLSGEVVIAGVAWAQTRGIEEVEVSIDDGPWQVAELGAEVNDNTWRQWKLPWAVTPGRHTITCRAFDASGDAQTGERARPMPDGATGWHSVVVMGEAA